MIASRNGKLYSFKGKRLINNFLTGEGVPKLKNKHKSTYMYNQ